MRAKPRSRHAIARPKKKKVMKKTKKVGAIVALLSAAVVANSPSACLQAGEFTLDNGQVSLTCQTKGGRLMPGTLADKQTGQVVKLGAELFSLVLTNGEVLQSSQFKLI